MNVSELQKNKTRLSQRTNLANLQYSRFPLLVVCSLDELEKKILHKQTNKHNHPQKTKTQEASPPCKKAQFQRKSFSFHPKQPRRRSTENHSKSVCSRRRKRKRRKCAILFFRKTFVFWKWIASDLSDCVVCYWMDVCVWSFLERTQKKRKASSCITIVIVNEPYQIIPNTLAQFKVGYCSKREKNIYLPLQKNHHHQLRHSYLLALFGRHLVSFTFLSKCCVLQWKHS